MAATSTNGDAHRAEAMAYAEDDKLGPLGGRRSVIDDDAELRRVLVAEFEAAAAAAREAAGTVDDSAVKAVHEYRKALRRARAILKLIAGQLPDSEQRAVRRALRDARRALGSTRDHAVAPDAAELLALGRDDGATLHTILDAAHQAVPPLAEIKQLLAEGAARAAAQVEALEASLPAALSWSTVLRGVRTTYRDARRARKEARHSKRAFHDWRRRSKELLNQLDLLSAYTGARVTDLHRELEAATDLQGPVVDLIMLREFARTHGDAVSSDALKALVHAITGEIDNRIGEARSAAKDAFHREPRRFARKLDKNAHRDIAPLDVVDDVD
jgi:CHAD domain-containing protein